MVTKTHLRKCILILLALLFIRCELDLRQIILCPDVETRVEQSQQLAPPSITVFSDTFQFAVFADLHIGKQSGGYLDRFQRAVESLGISFFCVAGDLTDHGMDSEYDSVKLLLRAIGPHLVTLGNHDLYRPNSWEKFKECFGPSCYSVTLSPRLRLIFLDTGEGRLGENQFTWLNEELQKSERIKIIITHFPIYDDETPTIFRLGSDAERARLLGLLARYQVYAYCAGHIHGYRHQLLGKTNHFTCGTISGALDFGKPGFLLFKVQGDSIGYQFINW